jgi:hypothetical protein
MSIQYSGPQFASKRGPVRGNLVQIGTGPLIFFAPKNGDAVVTKRVVWFRGSSNTATSVSIEL